MDHLCGTPLDLRDPSQSNPPRHHGAKNPLPPQHRPHHLNPHPHSVLVSRNKFFAPPPGQKPKKFCPWLSASVCGYSNLPSRFVAQINALTPRAPPAGTPPAPTASISPIDSTH